jgi:hypothetical protein
MVFEVLTKTTLTEPTLALCVRLLKSEGKRMRIGDDDILFVLLFGPDTEIQLFLDNEKFEAISLKEGGM